MKLQSFRLGQRVLGAFALVMGLSMLGSLVGVWRLGQLNQRIETLVQVDAQTLELSLLWAGAAEANIQRRILAMVVDDKDFVEAFNRKSNETSALLDKVQQRLGALAQDAEAKRLSDATGVTRQQFHTLRNELIKLKGEGQNVQARVLKELLPAMDRYLAAINAFADNARARLEAARADTRAAVSQTRWIVSALLLSALLLGLLIALAITRSVTAPLSDAQGLARQIAGGDLSQAVSVQGRDELAELSRALAEMQAQLGQTIAAVRGAAEQVQVASSEIATGSMDLSNRTEQAASSLEQTGAAMAQLGEGVRGNAESARQADQLAQGASQVADQGGQMVERVVQTMQGIRQASHKIGDIIGVIDGIAFQTNILALNAAVEAARAGDQGRGFAVVAGEVRALAQRSAQAAREIKGLISASMEQVEAGSRLVQDTGGTIAEVVQAVQRVTRIVAEISVATTAQAQTLGEVDQAVRQLDQMTQQNAALVEESAAAAASLKEQAVQLAEVVSSFRLP